MTPCTGYSMAGLEWNPRGVQLGKYVATLAETRDPSQLLDSPELQMPKSCCSGEKPQRGNYDPNRARRTERGITGLTPRPALCPSRTRGQVNQALRRGVCRLYACSTTVPSTTTAGSPLILLPFRGDLGAWALLAVHHHVHLRRRRSARHAHAGGTEARVAAPSNQRGWSAPTH